MHGKYYMVTVACAILVATAATLDEDCSISVNNCTSLIIPYIRDMESLRYLQTYEAICPYVGCYFALLFSYS